MILQTKPDMSVEPGHQWLVLPGTDHGYALAMLLAPHLLPKQDDDGNLLIPHTHVVDTGILELINTLAHVRFSAPGLVQMTLGEVREGRDLTLTPNPSPEGRGESIDDGLEGA